MSLKTILQNNITTENSRKLANLPGHKRASAVENLPKSNKQIGSNLLKIHNSIGNLDRKEVNQQTFKGRLSGLIIKIKTLLHTEKKPLEGPKLLELQSRPLPSRIASHALIKQFTPEIGRVADYICNKILNSHEMKKIDKLISNCDKALKNKVDKITNDCNKALEKADIGFLEMKNLYGNQFAIAFKEEFGHALATGSHLLDIQKAKEKVTGVQSIEHISDSQRLIELIEDYQELPEKKLEMRLEIKLKPTIPSPFRKEGYIETQADKDEAIAINTKNYGNTELIQNSYSVAYSHLPAEYKYKTENNQKAVIPEVEPESQNVVADKIEKKIKIKVEFDKDKKNTIEKSIESYKFLQENALAIFKLENSLPISARNSR